MTFDDGPGTETTEELLDGLKERGVKATFFLIGKSAEKNPDIVKRIKEDGHLIGNHTYSHVQLTDFTSSKAKAEITKANSIIENILGECPKYIRPPYGSYSDKLLMSVNMSPVLWTVDPNDWNTTNTAQVVRNVVSNVKCGDIILLHDIYKSSVAAALEIIDELQAKGYVFVTVDQIILD
ncbi:MAG: polysaccharide deacetylase family protein [Eubacteriales bacterium]|nr:polysaccharide deacetylase family protein [Eubacteriales bacterium]